MAWDTSRPVPWRRLVRDWLVYVGVMSVVFVVIYRDRLTPGVFAGLFASGPIFVGIGAILAKFGYQRRTLRDLRASSRPRGATSGPTKASPPATASRAKPAPTSRTGGGPQRPAGQRKR